MLIHLLHGANQVIFQSSYFILQLTYLFQWLKLMCIAFCCKNSQSQCKTAQTRVLSFLLLLVRSIWMQIYSLVRDIFALSYIQQHMGMLVISYNSSKGFFRNQEYVGSVKGQTIEQLLVDLCSQLTRYASDLVNAFGIPDFVMRSPLGLSDNQVCLHTNS